MALVRAVQSLDLAIKDALSSENLSVITELETTTIPNGLLGLNGQPEFIQTNVPNINYNKLTIYISSKENDVLYSFNEYEKSCQDIVNISVVLLSIISIFSIIIITLIFKDLLRLNLNGGDTHAD